MKIRKFDIGKFCEELNGLVANNATSESVKNFVIAYLQLEILRGNIILPEEDIPEEEKN